MYKRTSIIIISLILFINLNAQWHEQNSDFDTLRAIGHICAVDTNVVWAAGYDPTYISPVSEYTKTIDGGQNWEKGVISPSDSLQVSMIYALDPDLAYATLYELEGDTGKLMKTTDGGNNWSMIDSIQFTSNPKLVYFWNENEGMVVADPDSGYFQIYTTDDAGISWDQVEEFNMPASLPGELTSYKSYSVIGDTFWFGGVTNGKVFVTHDRGKNWSFIGTPLNNVTKVIFKDTCGIVGDVNTVSNSWDLYSTDNSGLSWTKLDPAGVVGYNDICYVPETPNAYISAGYSISYTADGGNNWFSFSPPNGGISPYYTNLAFVNPSTGWAGGVNFNNNAGGIYKYSGTPLSIDNNYYDNLTLDIFPNPGKGLFHIKTSTATAIITIYNLLGKQVFSKEDISETIDLSHLCPGVYIVNLKVDQRMIQTKLIISN